MPLVQRLTGRSVSAHNRPKLTRQNGQSNLSHKNTELPKTVDFQKNKTAPLGGNFSQRLVVPEVASSFEVFCDSPQSPEDNNIIHQIERLQRQEERTEKEKGKNLQLHSSSQSIEADLLDRLSNGPSRSTDQLSCATSVYEDACSSVYGSACEDISRPVSPSDEPIPPSVPDVELERNDVLFCDKDYSEDVYNYMRNREVVTRPNPKYMNKQSDINPEMRAILIDWMADVCSEYTVQLETFCLAANLIDRLLSKRLVTRMNLQLVGTAALMVASKFEEIYPPELKDFVYVTDETYTEEHILKMEKTILSTMGFNISTATTYWFANRLSHLCSLNRRSDLVVHYLVELSLVDIDYLHYLPSIIASSAVCATRILTGTADPWDTAMVAHTNMQIEEIMPCVRSLLSSFRNAAHATQTGIYEKYSDSSRLSVSLIPCPAELLQ